MMFRWLMLAATLVAATPNAFAQNAPYWRGDYEEGPCTDASCHSDWSIVQGESPTEADPSLNAVFSGVQWTGTEAISSHEGQDFAVFATNDAALDAGKPHSKAYKAWIFPGAPPGTDNFGRPFQPVSSSGIDGSYVAWFFIPSDYVYTGREWTGIFQFKLTEQSPFAQYPQWWVNLIGRQTDGALMLHVENWADGVLDHGKDIPAPKGRWFQIRADLYEGAGIDWYVDGIYWQSSSAATWVVGRDNDGIGTPQTFVFGVGHYGGVGRIAVDDASFTPK